MAPLLLLLNASKYLGLASAIVIAIDLISYRAFRKGNLLPFESPLDDSEEIIAKFAIDKDVDDGGFFFSLASAPAHVEDQLQDAWLEFAVAEDAKQGDKLTAIEAREEGSSPPAGGKSKKATAKKRKDSKTFEWGDGGVAAWQNACKPEDRLRFWSDPETELQLAKDANVTVYRMGVDWSRVMPKEPLNGFKEAVDWDAVDRYREIIELVRAKDMSVMLTLFHHSLPSWAAKYGGWRSPKTVDYFVQFTRLAVEKYADLVDFWMTFNEPHVFAMMTYCAGAWPGGSPNLLETATSVLPKGVFKVVMAAMMDAHNQAYDIIHDIGKQKSTRMKVGIAHHVSFMRPYGLFDVPIAMIMDFLTRFSFTDHTIKKLDYLGINYYGQEVLNAPGLKHVKNDEYSESGRGVYPDGLYRVLMSFHERYKQYDVPFIITENGISDSTDLIRRPYITEHLLAVKAAMVKGVKVQGYSFWTTSDNWEWADGYGPKFGLCAVDRENDLARTLRPSYHLFSEIAKTGVVTRDQRDQAWEDLMTAARDGTMRPFCRKLSGGLMYSGGLDVPIEIPLVERDWRFGHYEMEGLQDPLSRFIRFIFTGAFLGLNKRPKPSSAPQSPSSKGALADPLMKEMPEEALAAA